MVESSGTDDNIAAKKILQKRETEVDSGLPISPKGGFGSTKRPRTC
jgi:hypothetical protein